MATPICTIDQTGIHRPTLATVLAWAVAQFQAIYGTDVSLDSSTQDGEMVGLLASAIDDTNAMAVQAYNAFSPSTSQGTGLSSVVKINGIARAIPSYSSAQLLLVGVATTIITSGQVSDASGVVWNLPVSVVIPQAGQITATATCATLGSIPAAANTINVIVNTQPGWQTATNLTAATLGGPVEVDAQLRVRQSKSTMNSSTGLVQGLEGAILALGGVNRARVYSNTDNVPDINNIPGHTIAAVVEGGNITSILNTIMAKKGGCGTYGSVVGTVVDIYGVAAKVAYFPDVAVPITVNININQIQAFTTDIIATIKNSVATFINALGIGNNVQLTRLYPSVYLGGALNSTTYEVMSITLSRGGAAAAADIAIAYTEIATCVPTAITVTVLN